MRAVNWVQAGILAATVVVVLCGAARACPTVPSFSMDPRPEPGPDFPSPASLGKLEVFLSDNDLFRENAIEGYNLRLKHFSDNIDLIDAEARQSDLCTPEEYRAFQQAYDVEHAKVTADYLEPYRVAMNVYRANVRKYKVTHNICLWNRMNGRDGCDE